jgi:hypothetical protein
VPDAFRPADFRHFSGALIISPAYGFSFSFHCHYFRRFLPLIFFIFIYLFSPLHSITALPERDAPAFAMPLIIAAFFSVSPLPLLFSPLRYCYADY